MLTDSHCHPFYLSRVFPQAEEERKALGVIAVASACDLEEFTHNEQLAKKAAFDKYSPLFPCFAIHPQLPHAKSRGTLDDELIKGIDTLANLAAEGRLSAVGECGFDLYNAAFRETEAVQDRLFASHLEIALRYNLPVILHVRRAMHKVFAVSKNLSKCRAVIFHSWSGTLEEGQALLRRGVNAYFSFGNVIRKEHKQAMRCCALLPAQRILTETDAPYQPARGKNFSCWTDIPLIIEAASELRREAQCVVLNAKELENQIEQNFREAFFQSSLPFFSSTSSDSTSL